MRISSTLIVSLATLALPIRADRTRCVAEEPAPGAAATAPAGDSAAEDLVRKAEIMNLSLIHI